MRTRRPRPARIRGRRRRPRMRLRAVLRAQEPEPPVAIGDEPAGDRACASTRGLGGSLPDPAMRSAWPSGDGHRAQRAHRPQTRAFGLAGLAGRARALRSAAPVSSSTHVHDEDDLAGPYPRAAPRPIAPGVSACAGRAGTPCEARRPSSSLPRLSSASSRSVVPPNRVLPPVCHISSTHVAATAAPSSTTRDDLRHGSGLCPGPVRLTASSRRSARRSPTRRADRHAHPRHAHAHRGARRDALEDRRALAAEGHDPGPAVLDLDAAAGQDDLGEEALEQRLDRGASSPGGRSSRPARRCAARRRAAPGRRPRGSRGRPRRGGTCRGAAGPAPAPSRAPARGRAPRRERAAAAVRRRSGTRPPAARGTRTARPAARGGRAPAAALRTLLQRLDLHAVEHLRAEPLRAARGARA